jgi:hypothetical protein
MDATQQPSEQSGEDLPSKFVHGPVSLIKGGRYIISRASSFSSWQPMKKPVFQEMAFNLKKLCHVRESLCGGKDANCVVWNEYISKDVRKIYLFLKEQSLSNLFLQGRR